MRQTDHARKLVVIDGAGCEAALSVEMAGIPLVSNDRVEIRGVEDKPFSIPFLEEGSGNYIVVAVKVVDGYELKAFPLEKQGLAVSESGALVIKANQSRPVIYSGDDIASSITGKIALFICSPDGKLALGKFSGCGEKRNLVVDENGDVTCEKLNSCDDATSEIVEFNSIRVCATDESGSLYEINIKPKDDEPKIIRSCNGKMRFVKAPISEYPLDSPESLTLSLGNPTAAPPSTVYKAIGSHDLSFTLPQYPNNETNDDICDGAIIYVRIRIQWYFFEQGTSAGSSDGLILFEGQPLVAMGANAYGSSTGGAEFVVKTTSASQKITVRVSTANCNVGVTAQVVSYLY